MIIVKIFFVLQIPQKVPWVLAPYFESWSSRITPPCDNIFQNQGNMHNAHIAKGGWNSTLSKNRIPYLVCQFVSLWQNTWDNQFKKRKCLVLAVISVHGHFSIMFFVSVVKQYTMVEAHDVGGLLTSWWARSRGIEVGSGVLIASSTT
jgi:hypothetical protein